MIILSIVVVSCPFLKEDAISYSTAEATMFFIFLHITWTETFSLDVPFF